MEKEVLEWLKRKKKNAGISESERPSEEIEKPLPERAARIKEEAEVKREGEVTEPLMTGRVDVDKKIEEFVQESFAAEKEQAEPKPILRTKLQTKQQTPKIGRDLFTKKRILIAILAGAVGALCGYLVYIFLV